MPGRGIPKRHHVEGASSAGRAADALVRPPAFPSGRGKLRNCANRADYVPCTNRISAGWTVEAGKVEGRRSKVEGRRSKVESRRSKVEGRRSKVEGPLGPGGVEPPGGRSTSTSRTAPTITHLTRHGADAEASRRPSALQSPGLGQARKPTNPAGPTWDNTTRQMPGQAGVDFFLSAGRRIRNLPYARHHRQGRTISRQDGTIFPNEVVAWHIIADTAP